ncbi:MAG: tetratricopeptide repeat protein, partial [Pseudomonadota bacterium]
VELREARDAFGPHPDVLTYLGFANRKQGNHDVALAYYSAALDVAPGHLGAHEYLGEYFVEIGDMTAARSQLDTLNVLCPFGCAEHTELEQWIERDAS